MAQNMVSTSGNLDDTHISDIMKYEKDHPVDFVAKSTNIFDVETIFEKSHKVKKKLEAVIITENGKKDETPLGIITPWDLIEIDYTVD
jgi:predicted nucleotidyltransferase